jgi:segregation and condensation protein B
MEELKSVIEALVWAAELPLSLDKIAEIMETADKKAIGRHLEELINEYEGRKGGICLQEVAGGFQFRTRSDLAPWIKKLRGTRASLTPAAMETLAVIAYRQPVVKSEIDRIRGVDTGGPLKKLLERKLVRIVGRKDVPGKPIIYGTTKRFLEVFNLKDLADLPTFQELKELGL